MTGRPIACLFEIALLSALLLGLKAKPTYAQQLVYHPIDPAFGGNPLNGQWLLGNAQAQKRAPDFSLLDQDPLADFQQGLQRQILSALSREIVLAQIGDNLDLTQPGRYELGNYTVEVVPGLNGVSIVVTNILTGEQTSIAIPGF